MTTNKETVLADDYVKEKAACFGIRVEYIRHIESAVIAKLGGMPGEPLSVFAAGTWTWSETGQSFTAEELNGEAFVRYRSRIHPTLTEAAPTIRDSLMVGGEAGAVRDEDLILVPRGLIGAACYAIRKKRDAPKTLSELRRYTVGDLSDPAAPAAEPVARAHVTLEDDGLHAELEVLDGARMQVGHSPVDLYLAAPTAESAQPTAATPDFADAYTGAREDLAIWKKRALSAEARHRHSTGTVRKLCAALNQENGPMFMGEPTAATADAQPYEEFEDAEGNVCGRLKGATADAQLSGNPGELDAQGDVIEAGDVADDAITGEPVVLPKNQASVYHGLMRLHQSLGNPLLMEAAQLIKDQRRELFAMGTLPVADARGDERAKAEFAYLNFLVPVGAGPWEYYWQAWQDRAALAAKGQP